MLTESALSWIDALTGRLAGPLPGRSAQHRMASLRRLEELGENPLPPPDHRVACVLILLLWQQDEWHTLLIQRTANPRDRHSGQVSFPGGRWEPEDGPLVNCALREVEEEVGISPSRVRIIGALTDLYIPVSNFVVHPFVGLLHTPGPFYPQPGEVETIILAPLSLFQEGRNRKTTDLTVAPGIHLQSVPYYDVDGRIVWGATAMILSEFLHLL